MDVVGIFKDRGYRRSQHELDGERGGQGGPTCTKEIVSEIKSESLGMNNTTRVGKSCTLEAIELFLST